MTLTRFVISAIACHFSFQSLLAHAQSFSTENVIIIINGNQYSCTPREGAVPSCSEATAQANRTFEQCVNAGLSSQECMDQAFNPQARPFNCKPWRQACYDRCSRTTLEDQACLTRCFGSVN